MLAPAQHHDETVYALALLEMRIDDFIDVFGRGRPIPDAFRINHHQWTRSAESEAASSGKTYFRKSLSLNRPAQTVPQWLSTGRTTASSRMVGWPLRETRENMVLVNLRDVDHDVFDTCSHAAATVMPFSFNIAASSPV